MSKRLNKRQQREQEELEQLKAVQQQSIAPVGDHEDEAEEADASDEVKEEEEAGSGKPVNAFAALGAGGDDAEEDVDVDEEEEEEAATAVKKNKKKKPKKKKKKSTAATPALDDEEEDDTAGPSTSTPSKAASTKKGKAAAADDDMDEVDRALAELNMKYGKESGLPTAGKAAVAGPSSSSLGFRQMLAVDPKNLDADAELKRFFGSKVISSTAASSKSHRPTASSKLRYTISKPKPTYPPATSLAGLGMRELTDEEVEDAQSMRMSAWRDPAEKWFTFEHAGVWRETTRQFLGAVASHDPNQLMALLQVYPWHVDTLLQMSEVYRLQSDIGAASEYAERALYALDRCLIPAFNVSSGACRLNFDRVENRPMFLALHRIISYLGRRGCWVTAFNFAKLLFSLDPMGDPHGAAFWLDFLAIKSGNYAWIISMFEEHSEQFPVAVFQGYPGMAFAYALACRAREDAEKDKDRTRSNDALREAILAFPQAVIPLADKIGAEVPASARTHPLMQVQAGYSDDPTCAIHLLSHIYASRSDALWKEAPLISWFSSSISANMPDLDRPDAKVSREDVIRLIQTPRDPHDEHLSVPIFMCRHILCSESTSFVGFIPPIIHKRPFHMFDPLPPMTATTGYNNDYFSGVQPPRRANTRAGLGTEQGEREMMGEFMNNVFYQRDTNPTGWREALMNGWRGMMGQPIMGREMPREEREEAVQGMMRLAEEMVERRERGEGTPMPGGFPDT